MRTILVTTDLTPASEPALGLAARLAAEAGAALHAVHAMEVFGLTLREAFEPLRGGLVPGTQAALEAQVRRAADPADAPVTWSLDYHDPARAIRALCGRIDVALVVLGGDPARVCRGADPAGFAAGLAEELSVPVLLPGEGEEPAVARADGPDAALAGGSGRAPLLVVPRTPREEDAVRVGPRETPLSGRLR